MSEPEYVDGWQQTPSNPIDDLQAAFRNVKGIEPGKPAPRWYGDGETRPVRSRLNYLRTHTVRHEGVAHWTSNFPRVNDTPYLNDLLIRAWKRDLHEVCESEAAKMRERRAAKERAR